MNVEKTIHNYDDIIDVPHHQSSTHKQMSLYDRAAQFSPFAALTGHDIAVKETARLTDQRIELDEYEKAALNDKLLIIKDNLPTDVAVSVTFFKPDDRKPGGAYLTVTNTVKKINDYEQTLVLSDNTIIPIDQIFVLESELFHSLETFY